MILATLQLQSFRNYRQLHCEFSPAVNLITGANAQGKTNLIEGIYYLSVGRSFRQAKDEQLIHWGERQFQIAASIEGKGGKNSLRIVFCREKKPAKSIQAGGLALSRGEELNGALTSVLFSPDSMAIVKGPPQARRGFLNYDLSQISLTYARNLRKYSQLLAQRNALLKNLGRLSLPMADKIERLSIWDGQLMELGATIVEKRLSAVEKLAPLARLVQRGLTGGREKLELQYCLVTQDGVQPGAALSKEQGIAGFLRKARDAALAEELRWGITRWGPHRDELKIILDGADIRQYGSQGQQRTAVLALKLAELEFFRGESGEYPLLLLDDVLSELDADRQRQLLDFIHKKSIQCLITAAETKNIDFHEKRQIKRFLVNRGEIEAM